ncbi:MAG: translation initiation factor IF-3 [Clostridia bacterium]|nr:translation initiation factor IF-3 [Clostridia bacterium]
MFWRCVSISAKELAVNEEIKFKEVRTISADGAQLGIIPVAKALEAAYAADLDLVCISPNAQPPVCKIMDYGKYRFEQAKREKEAKKNQKTFEIKEIRLGLSIDVHDFETKGRHAMRFLEDGNKVKVSIRFRGRELGHPEIGLDTMKRFAEFCQEYASVEKPAKMEGRNMIMFLAPKTGK